jgi:hypothetical protein
MVREFFAPYSDGAQKISLLNVSSLWYGVMKQYDISGWSQTISANRIFTTFSRLGRREYF